MIFFTGNRVSNWKLSLSIAMAWVWAPAMVVSGNIAAQYGAWGMFWFVVPNALALAAFGWLAQRVRERHPRGFTLYEFVQAEYPRLGRVYQYGMTFIQMCAVAIQAIAIGNVMEVVFDISYWLGLLLSGTAMAVIYARGFTGALWLNGGLALLAAGLSATGFTVGRLPTDWAPAGAFIGFGLQSIVVLFAGPPADQQHWQRAYSIRKTQDMTRVFAYGAVLFAVIPTSLCLIGLVARESGIAGGTVIATYLSRTYPWVARAYALVLAGVLVSSSANALSAGSCLENKHSKQSARARMAMVYGCGLLIAVLRPTLLDLWFFYGSLRTALLLPTLALMLRRHPNEKRLLYAIGIAVVIGLVIYIYVAPVFGVLALLLIPSLGIGGKR